ncbi:MAG: hypothetical protein HY402_03900, partial [Elusimicrobia bacterium]|nr:hypothetical protein [Elusimicrobiota bacterium]
MIELLQIYLRGLAGIAVGLLGLGFLSPPAWGNVFEQGAGQLVQAVSGLDASEGKYAGLDLHVHTYCSD